MRLALFVLLVLSLAGCRPKAPDLPEGGVRLVYWTSPNPQERAMAERLAAEWQAMHPHVEIVVRPIPAGQSSEEVILAAVAGGTTPDLCSNIWPGLVADLVRAGGVLALDEMPGFDTLATSRLPDGMADLFRSPDGRLYQWPWKTNPILMLYNPAMFEEIGQQEPPATYSAYLDAAERLSALPGKRWMGYRDIRPIWWQRYFDFFSLYIGASEGQTLFDTRGDLAIDTTATREVYGFLQALYTRGFFPKTTFQGNPFLEGRIATEFTGPWSAAFLEENAPAGFRFDYAPLPVPDHHQGPVHTYGDFKNIAIFSRTRHPEEAWKFLQFLVSREADLRLLTEARQIPVRRDLLSDPYFRSVFETQPYLRRFAEAAPYARSVDAVPGFAEMLDAVALGMERAVYATETPAEATASTVRRIQMIHAWKR